MAFILNSSPLQSTTVQISPGYDEGGGGTNRFFDGVLLAETNASFGGKPARKITIIRPCCGSLFHISCCVRLYSPTRLRGSRTSFTRFHSLRTMYRLLLHNSIIPGVLAAYTHGCVFLIPSTSWSINDCITSTCSDDGDEEWKCPAAAAAYNDLAGLSQSTPANIVEQSHGAYTESGKLR